MDALLSSDVPDPTDFPSSTVAPGLRALDSSLRCTICGELFDAPVTLPCGHCFCSFCVRTAMAIKQECPGCRKVANEGHLRPNPCMEDVVTAWKLARPYILKLSKDDERRLSSGRQESPLKSNAKKRKRSNGSCRGTDGSLTLSSESTPASPSKPRRPRQRGDSSDDVFDMTTIPTSDADEDEMPNRSSHDPGSDDIVKCPLCAKAVIYKNINLHIDKGCKDTPAKSKKSEWMRLMSVPNKGKHKETNDVEEIFPIPKASYGTLKEKQLREMLLEHELPTHGDRNLCIQRHQRWVMIYNANLDRSTSNRKSKQELRRELNKWENEKARKKKHTVDDGIAHEKRHKSQFTQLINVARGKNNAPVTNPPPLSSDSSRSDVTVPSLHNEKGRPEQLQYRDEDIIAIDSEEERERS